MCEDVQAAPRVCTHRVIRARRLTEVDDRPLPVRLLHRLKQGQLGLEVGLWGSQEGGAAVRRSRGALLFRDQGNRWGCGNDGPGRPPLRCRGAPGGAAPPQSWSTPPRRRRRTAGPGGG